MLNLLNQLAATSGTNDKIALLKSYADDPVVKAVFLYAYNPRVKYWIKKRPPATSSLESNSNLMGAITNLVVTISFRKVTGNEAIDYVTNLLNNLSPDDQEVLYRIIERDLKCGVNVKLINKVWKNLIPEYPVLLCSKFNEKTEKNIKYPAIFQKKEDGGRVNLEFDNGVFISATTRNGNVLDISCFDGLTINTLERCILDGELLYTPNDIIADRKIGNGIVTKAIRNTISEQEAADLIFVCWDYIPYYDFLNEYSGLVYNTRFNTAINVIPADSTKLRIIESEIVNSREEVMEKYRRNLELGYEGGILKSLDGIWSCGRSKYQLKLKAEDPIDLLVVGFEYGAPGTQFEGMLGSLICETACGRLRVNVGTGFKHKRGERDNPESYVGKIIEVKYNCIISSQGSDIKSLFLPVFSCVRDDKNTANSLEDVE